MNPWFAIALVLAALGALMLAVRALQHGGAVGAEVARKLVHVGMGSVCLTFPWLFSAAWPTWLLAGLAAVALAAVRLVTPLRERFGNVLGGVRRASWGEIYFPIAVALVFTLADGEAAFFCVPVAILTFGDAAGALVGERWGRTRYQAVESTKSVEGSTAVLVVTWLCVAAGLVSLAGASWPEALLAGGAIGLFAMLVEAVSWRGLDNLLLPLVAWAQLNVFARLAATELATRVVVLGLLALFMLTWRRRHLLDDSARLGAALAAYLFWALGDWRWLVAPALLIVSYVRLMPTIASGPPRHGFAAVLCLASAGLAWALANAIEPDSRWLWPFTLGLATQQAIIATVRFSQGRPRWAPWQWWLVAIAQAAVVHALGFAAVGGIALVPPAAWAWGGVALAGFVAVFMLWDPHLQLPDSLNARWWRQGTMAALASAVGFIGMTS